MISITEAFAPRWDTEETITSIKYKAASYWFLDDLFTVSRTFSSRKLLQICIIADRGEGMGDHGPVRGGVGGAGEVVDRQRYAMLQESDKDIGDVAPSRLARSPGLR